MLASMRHLQYWIWQLGCLLALCLIRPFPEYLQYSASALHDTPVIQANDAVGIDEFVTMVGDENDGCAVLLQFVKNMHDVGIAAFGLDAESDKQPAVQRRQAYQGGRQHHPQLRLEQGIVFRFGNFYLLHTVCILIYLLFVKLCVPQLQVYDEAATFAQFAFHTDGAVMELHDTLRQCQADTRTRLACICRVHLVYLVEAVEYLVHFPGIYAAAGIGHADDGIAAFGLFPFCVYKFVVMY